MHKSIKSNEKMWGEKIKKLSTRKLTREEELEIIAAALDWGMTMSVHYIEPSPHSEELDDIDDAREILRLAVMPIAKRVIRSQTWETCGRPTKKRLAELRNEWNVD